MPFEKVANVNDLKPGQGKLIFALGEEIALFNVDGFYAVNNSCLHRNGPLSEGFLDGEIVSLHGW